jgi:hypothetical protein
MRWLVAAAAAAAYIPFLPPYTYKTVIIALIQLWLASRCPYFLRPGTSKGCPWPDFFMYQQHGWTSHKKWQRCVNKIKNKSSRRK